MRRAAVLALLIASAVGADQRFKLPPLAPPELYGNMLIWRTTANASVKPVMFSHWSHRLRYTCRVCHLELDFAFKRNTTEITEAANRAGSYCGACHNGKIAFAHTAENCDKCHTGNVATSADIRKLDDLPWAPYGNGVNWSAAIAAGTIKPAASLAPGYKPIALDTTLNLEAEWNFVPPAVFPHKEHVRIPRSSTSGRSRRSTSRCATSWPANSAGRATFASRSRSTTAGAVIPT